MTRKRNAEAISQKKASSALARLSVWTAAVRLLQMLFDLVREFGRLLGW